MVHVPRSVACPVCGETRFRSSDGAVQHVESGACSGCRGQETARTNVYQFLAGQQVIGIQMTRSGLSPPGGQTASSSAADAGARGQDWRLPAT